MIFGVPEDNLREFSQDNKKYGFVNLPEDKFRLRNEEHTGTTDNVDKEEDDEQMMSKIFDKINDKDADVGRYSVSGKTEGDDDLDFDQQSMASKATSKDEEAFADIRASTMMRSRRPTSVKLEDFEIKMQLGKGTFGRVFLAELPSSKTLYAIKAIRKDVLIEYDQITSTLLEKDILFTADHPFLAGMEFLFQSEIRLYFVMPFINGGELYKIFQEERRFPEVVVKFYAAQIILAIGELHK